MSLTQIIARGAALTGLTLALAVPTTAQHPIGSIIRGDMPGGYGAGPQPQGMQGPGGHPGGNWGGHGWSGGDHDGDRGGRGWNGEGHGWSGGGHGHWRGGYGGGYGGAYGYQYGTPGYSYGYHEEPVYQDVEVPSEPIITRHVETHTYYVDVPVYQRVVHRWHPVWHRPVCACQIIVRRPVWHPRWHPVWHPKHVWHKPVWHPQGS